MKDRTFEVNEEMVKTLILCGLTTFVGGYLVGRFTALSDLKNGYLNYFIPNK